MFYNEYPKKMIFVVKVPPIDPSGPIGGILTFLRKIFAPYRVGGLYKKRSRWEDYKHKLYPEFDQTFKKQT